MLNANEKFVTALVERAKELGWGCTIDTEDSSIEFKQSSPEKTFVSVPMGTLRRKLLAASANMPRTLTLRNM